MTRLIGIGTVIFLLAAIFFFGCERVEQGYRGAEVDLMGGDRGAVTEKGPGFYVYNRFTTDFIELPIHVQRWAYVADSSEQVEEDQSINAVSSDNLEFDVGVAVHYYVRPTDGCITSVYRKYKTGNFEYLSLGPVRDIVRESVHNVYSQYEAGEIYGVKRPEVMEKVTDDVKQTLSSRVYVEQNGEKVGCFVIDNMSLAGLKAPQSVIEAVEQKMRAQQKAEQAKAELQEQKISSKRDSVKAAQDAENNRMIRESITSELIQYKKLELMQERWDGSLPRVITGSNTGLMLDTQ